MTLNKLDLQKHGLTAMLSDVESDLLTVLWKEKQANARILFDAIKGKHALAYSSTVVYLDRLYSKGLLERKIERGKGGLRYIYLPKYSKQELGNKIADNFISFLKASFGESSTAYLRKKLK